MKTLKIGNIKLKNPLILAPMLDVTNLPFRLISRKSGCSMAYSEMIHIDALIQKNKNKNLLSKLKTTKKDSPLGLQITTNNVSKIKKSIPLLQKFNNYDLIDLNCGCPSNLTIDHKSGAYLLTSPPKIKRILTILKDNGFTATAKIRLGFKKNNCLKIAKSIESSGADAITIHGRLSTQTKSTSSNWKEVKKISRKIGIPLIYNGDIDSGIKAKQFLDFSDGIMIGRSAISNPSIFKNILHYFKTGQEPKKDFTKNVNLFLEYLKFSEKYSLINLSQIKYFGSNIIREIPGAPSYRKKLMSLQSFPQIELFFKNLKNQKA